jgi:ornithine carbamoyltransferase
MHCLPVRRNVVVDDAVLDGPSSLVARQARMRVDANAAIITALLGGAQ